MKVEISEDQNVLTVNGVEYEAKPNNAISPKSACKSCAFLGDGFFCKIAMETPLGVNASDLRRCEYPYRNDGKSIFWVKKEAEQVSEQNINFSDDENSLTIKYGVYKGEYEAIKSKNSCGDCSFLQVNSVCALGGIGQSKCTVPRRLDNQSIIWIKKEAEQMTEAPAPAPAPVPHRHFDLIVQWAKDPTQHVWAWHGRAKQWVWIKDPEWVADFYALGEKPTAPPIKKFKVKIDLDRNEFEIEVPYDARPQEVDKAILDMATHYMIVTQEVI